MEDAFMVPLHWRTDIVWLTAIWGSGVCVQVSSPSLCRVLLISLIYALRVPSLKHTPTDRNIVSIMHCKVSNFYNPCVGSSRTCGLPINVNLFCFAGKLFMLPGGRLRISALVLFKVTWQAKKISEHPSRILN